MRVCLQNKIESRIEETGGEPAGTLRCLSQCFGVKRVMKQQKRKGARVALPECVV